MDGDDLGSAYADSLRGAALVSLGRYDEAERLFEEVLPCHEGHVMAAHAYFHLGLVAFERDDRERARSLFQQAVELYDARHAWLDGIEPLHYLGLNACAEDNLHAASTYFIAVLARLRARRSRVDFANGFADVATLAVARGDLVHAARLFGAADALRREGGAPFPLPARIAYERAADRARIQLGEIEWASSYAAGTALPLEDALLEAAGALAPGAPLSPERGTATQSLQPQSSSQETPVVMLTRREREVLQLLCQRLTDPEIAQALFLSSRTASNHVAHILAKLGASNRREAAALAARHRLV